MRAFLLVGVLFISGKSWGDPVREFSDCTALFDRLHRITPQDLPKSVPTIPIEQAESITKKEVLAIRSRPEKIETSPLFEKLPPEVLLGPVPHQFVDLFGWDSFLIQKGSDRFNTKKWARGTPLDTKLNGLFIFSSNQSSAHTVREGRPGYQILEIHMVIPGRKLRELMRLADELHLDRNLATLDEFTRYSEEYAKLYHQVSLGTPGAQANLEAHIKNKFVTRAFSLEASNQITRKIEVFDYDDLPIGTRMINSGETLEQFSPDEHQNYRVVLTSKHSLVPVMYNGKTRYIENNHDTNRFILMQFFVEKVLPLLH